MKSLNARLQTSEQHAELIKIYSSPLAPQSPLVVNSRTVSKIATTSFHPHPSLPPPMINLQADCDVKESGCDPNCVNTSDGSSIELSPSITRVRDIDDLFPRVYLSSIITCMMYFSKQKPLKFEKKVLSEKQIFFARFYFQFVIL